MTEPEPNDFEITLLFIIFSLVIATAIAGILSFSVLAIEGSFGGATIFIIATAIILPSILSPMNLPRGMSLIGKSNQAIGSISAGSLSMIGEAVARPANL
jgi:hypothetical protein